MSISDLYLYNKDAFTPVFILKITIGIINALKTLHTIGYTHNDIKSNNIMIKNIDSDEPDVVLIDYGFARKLIEVDGNLKERGEVDLFEGNIMNASLNQMNFK